jgi:hypothetical protein
MYDLLKEEYHERTNARVLWEYSHDRQAKLVTEELATIITQKETLIAKMRRTLPYALYKELVEYHNSTNQEFKKYYLIFSNDEMY